MGDEVSITVIATGFDSSRKRDGHRAQTHRGRRPSATSGA